MYVDVSMRRHRAKIKEASYSLTTTVILDIAIKTHWSGAKKTGAHFFQAVEHPELDTFGLMAIRNILKKRARYLRIVAQNNMTDGVNFLPIIVVASIGPELLENLIDMEKIDADSVRTRGRWSFWNSHKKVNRM
jgi:hypothetical protein